MTRYLRNTVIQAKLETVYGTDPGAWGATDAILIANPDFKIDRDVVPRQLVRGYYGGSEHLIGTRRAQISFEVEMAGSGAAGTPPAWGALLRACGMAETITALNRVEYTPITTAFESMTMRYFIDGVLYVSRGCRGTVSVDMTSYAVPKLKFAMSGFDTNAVANAVPATNFAAWQRPLVLTDANAGDIRLGGAYNLGGITGGTVLASRKLMLDLGNKVSHIKMLGGEEIDIADRETSGSMSVFLTAADEVTWRTDLNANTLTTLGFNFGGTAGARVSVFCPAVQRVNPQSEDFEGRAMVSTELRVLPDAGNDEIKIVAR